MSGQTWPSRELVITCTHPVLGDEPFAPLVDEALAEVAKIGTDSLRSLADASGFMRTYQSPNGVTVVIRSAPRTFKE